MATNWFASENRLGVTSLMGVDSVANQITNANNTQPIGTVVRGYDATLGAGEFIYLQGVASLAVGNLVTYNPTTGVVVLSPNTAHLGQPVAVSLAANTSASNYSWYQIEGAAVITKNATKVSPGSSIYQSSTAASVTGTVASGKQVLNAISLNAATVASATGTVSVLINRPFLQGQIV
jgi:hypothetical protein